MINVPDRELISKNQNPLGIDGIEFIEYTTRKPQALGQILEMMGFFPVARHRSREVTLFRQGAMNVIVNAHHSEPRTSHRDGMDSYISGFALRVKDAATAFQRALDLGAWGVPSKAQVMELNIPAIHGVGGSRIFFVDRYKEFSIYDVDFIFSPGKERQVPSDAKLTFFGLVQYVADGRLNDWTEYYVELFDFSVLSDSERFGILPKGRILQSPCKQFYLQIVEPDPSFVIINSTEELHRIGLGSANVLDSVAHLKAKGIEFIDSPVLHVDNRGALTETYLGGVSFELVRDTKELAQ
jgi:4-hydroxyphenylpyruvate dioxygenase